MSLFNSQTIFNILITLIICSAIFFFFRFKLRVLEISQTEQAKVLQSLVMNMRNGGRPRNMVSDEEIMKHVQMQMQMNEGGAGANASDPSNRNRHPNELIDVSDDDEDDDDEDDDDDESESSSDSEDDDSDSDDNNDENHNNTTKKIIFNNSGVLDTHAHTIEHLTGDDIKIIELTEPLYHVGGAHDSKMSNRDTNDVSDDDNDDDNDDNDDDDDDEDMSDDDNDNDNDNDNEGTSDGIEVKTEELPNHASLPLQQEQEQEQEQEQHLETSPTDTTEIKTIFKADKQQHADYNSMNVQALKQLLKTKLSADGMQYNETAINKLNKKELIKHLTQG